MAGSQVVNGKALEWSVANALASYFNTVVRSSEAAITAQDCFAQLGPNKQQQFDRAASAAIAHIRSLEMEGFRNSESLGVELQTDGAGQAGDVRDVVLFSPVRSLGISCKTNHDAFKHSRLSDSIDFVRDWGLHPDGCSSTYWNDVKPVFLRLREIRAVSDGKALFSSQPDVPQDFYWPVLRAFEKELTRLASMDAQSSAEAVSQLVRYVVGRKDFYKVICLKDSVVIQAFNFGGSLKAPVGKLPDRLLSIDKFDGGKFSVNVRMNRGYQFNFRIHNASSRVEPSLKFDVRAVSLPPKEVYTHHIQL